jgi:hypothetical protein
MKRKKLAGAFYVCFLVLSLILPSVIWAATFNVSDVSQFQSALTIASSNGEDDTINVAAGTYTITSTLTYTSTGDENHSLEIIGAVSGSTILFGSNTAQILNINTVEPDADITVRYIEFQNGNSSGYGGGLNISVDSSDISVENSEFNNNIAAENGGGASLVSNSGSVTLQNCTFNNNSTGNDGAGLAAWTDTGTISISGSSFDNNSTATTGGDDGGGASAVTVSGQVTVTDNTFSNNESGDDGAGLFTYVEGEGGIITISDNNLTNNQAGLGGGGSFTRVNLSGTVTVTNNTFMNNSTLNGGGGGSLVYCQSGSVSFTGNEYSNNTTSVSGGEPDGAGVWTWIGSGALTLTANRFYHNDAGRNGGGISLNSETGAITLANNIFHNNYAVNLGGGVSIATGSATAGFYNDTFHENNAGDGGGGIDFYSLSSSTNVHIYNAIIYGSAPQAISQSGVGSVLASYSDIDGGTGQSWFGTGCIDAYPLFTDPTNGGFQLQAGSPCIDAGNSLPWIPSTDFDGNPRVSGSEVDMGAFEYGSGVSDTPNISVSPASNDFGSITVGSSSSPQTFTISNTGTADLDISSMSITGSDSGQFTLQTGTCTTLAPTISLGGSCTVTVTFSPTSEGSKSATLQIASNDPDTATLNVSLSGTGGAQAADLPDLTGQWLTMTQTCKTKKSGTKCKIKGQLSIQNIGTQDATTSFVRYYLSTDNTYNAGDTFLKQVATGKVKVNKPKTKKLSYSFQTGQSASGQYVIAVIDADNAISESNETNNNISYFFEGGAPPADTTPPSVTSINPAGNATGVSVSTSITATFSEAMDSSTITTSTFTVSGVSGTVTYSGNTATFTPSGNLAYNTTYTATITTGVRDLAGNAMASNYTWSFTTASGTEPPPATLTNLFFLHHSTGDGLIVEGDMRSAISSYNSSHSTQFVFWDHGYNSDGLRNAQGDFTGTNYNIPGDNTDPDGLYNLWTSTETEYVSARNQILNNHEVIAFKSCFPASDIPDAATLTQYQTWYLGMRDFFDTRTDRLFIVMSTPPLHRLATDSTAATNARAFADWLCSDTYLSGHPNIQCFNLFDQLAHSDDGSDNANMLRYEYEGSHSDSDSHPNTLANQTVGPVFAEFLCTSAASY